MEEYIVSSLKKSLAMAKEKGKLRLEVVPPIIVEVPKEEEMGDLATTIAFSLASTEKRAPIQIAKTILEHFKDDMGIIDKIEVAGPGFINFYIKKVFWHEQLIRIDKKGTAYGRLDIGKGEKVQVEFVSANPTGPLHVGHGRGAAVGDALTNLLKAVGYDVQKEYYINDIGTQMETLGRSTYIRYLQTLGRDIPFIEGGYQGDYIRDIAKKIIESQGNRFLDIPEKECIPFFTDYAQKSIMEGINEDLNNFGVIFNNWFSESSLYRGGEVDKVLKELKKNDYAYERDGAQWVNTSSFGDDKDRVVVRKNGQTTYFASDIAYHRNKYKRGFKKVIDIWGADHHGYVPRMKAVVRILGYPEDSLSVLLVQLVRLLRGGEPVAMSTRAGEFVTLREVISEVGRDAARFFFLMRRCDSHLDFDLELAKKESSENPIYYVQYAHARICSIFKEAEKRGVRSEPGDAVDLQLLTLPEELRIIKQVTLYQDLLKTSAALLEPHRLTFYLQELAANFHNYYHKYRVVSEDEALTRARLVLARGIKTVLKSALDILGVSAPERM